MLMLPISMNLIWLNFEMYFCQREERVNWFSVALQCNFLCTFHFIEFYFCSHDSNQEWIAFVL